MTGHSVEDRMDCYQYGKVGINMNIGDVYQALMQGERCAREGWNGKGMWIALQKPDANSKMTLPYVYMKTAQGDLVPWLCSQSDFLATDWAVVAKDPKG